MRGDDRAPGQGATIDRNRASRGPTARNNDRNNRDDRRNDRVRNYPNNDDGTSDAERRARIDQGHPQTSGPGSAIGLPGSAQPGSGVGLPNQRDQDGLARPSLDSPSLFGDPTLADRMGFDQQQFGQFSQAYNNALRQYEAARAQLPPDLSNEERNARLGQLRQQFNQQFMDQAGDFFQNPLQRERFQQLQMQYQGFNAFDDPAIQDHLNLTGEQIVRLNRLAEDWNMQLDDFYQQYHEAGYRPAPYFVERGQGEQGNVPGTLGADDDNRPADPETAFQQMQRMRWQQIYNILDDDQRYLYFQMTGSPYTFPMQAYVQGTNPGSSTFNNNQAPATQGTVNQGLQGTGFQERGNVPQGQSPQGASTPQGSSTPQGASTPQGTSAPGTTPPPGTTGNQGPNDPQPNLVPRAGGGGTSGAGGPGPGRVD